MSPTEVAGGPRLAEFASRWVDAALSVGAVELVLQEMARRGILPPDTTASCRGRMEERNWHDSENESGEFSDPTRKCVENGADGMSSSAAQRVTAKICLLRRKMRQSS